MDKNGNSGATTLKRGAKILGWILLGILGIVLVIGIIPVSKKGLASNTNPVNDYETAAAQVNAILDAEKGVVKEASYSRFMTHGEKTDRVYILVHGWTNSPRQFVELGELLYEQGHNVFIPRIPHHGLMGADVGELKNVNPEDMSAYADQIVDIAAGLGDEVHVVGLSVGGTIAAWTAQNRPDVDRVMLISPMLGLGEMPEFVDLFLINFFTRIPNINLIDPEEPFREHVYRGQSTRGVAEAMLFGETIFSQVGDTAPAAPKIIVVTNANDHTVDNAHAEKLADAWEAWGDDITRYEFPASLGLPHNSIDVSEPDTDTDLVYEKILELLGE